MYAEPNKRRWYQRPRRRHASGEAEWHCRTPKLRRLQREIARAADLRDLARRIRSVLD